MWFNNPGLDSKAHLLLISKIIGLIGLLLIVLNHGINTVYAHSMNGFDLSNSSIDSSKIFSGGPPRDGIPAIDKPKFIAVSEVNYLSSEDQVISFSHGKITRAYPLRILVWHEIVNDSIGDKAIAITYCPLCGTAMVFERNFSINNQQEIKSFGVSGLLYQSDVLMYDRQSESLWSQLAMQAISGPAKGSKLKWLASEQMSWYEWTQKYPDGQVLSLDTGFKRHYQGEAYKDYFASNRPMFPVPETRDELKLKSWVLGIIIDGQAKAYAMDDLAKNKHLKDKLGAKQISITYDPKSKYAQVKDATGESIPSVQVFWFAWQAFYPQTQVWKHPQ